jgi:hypothetical protein
MKWRVMLCGLVVGACVAVAMAPTAVGSGCGQGYEEGAGTEYDDDGDGLVCVNQETGEVTDDQGATPGVVDRNGDGIVCGKATGSGSIVTTDNNSSHTENGGCPPAFSPIPFG